MWDSNYKTHNNIIPRVKLLDFYNIYSIYFCCSAIATTPTTTTSKSEAGSANNNDFSAYFYNSST